MSDLHLDSAALRSAATTLQHAVREARSLPLVAESAWIAYDAGPGPVGTAAVHFLEGAAQSVLAMVHAGEDLAAWLVETAAAFEQVEGELATAAGEPP